MRFHTKTVVAISSLWPAWRKKESSTNPRFERGRLEAMVINHLFYLL
ncbi:MAG: hypothetical protein BWY21_01154 [Parcubacteria group bacterium ADurb.Bin216]|nr:MAG: hypothetical protein BWY21_01154 [Parcubacteria group bacterium ADurb.Bin216]